MAQRLKKMRVNEVSAVDRPANQHADILIIKRDGGFEPCGDCPSGDGCASAGRCRMKKGSKMAGKKKFEPLGKAECKLLETALTAVSDSRMVLAKGLGGDDDAEDEAMDATFAVASAIMKGGDIVKKASPSFGDLMKGKEEAEQISRAVYALQDCLSTVMYDRTIGAKEKVAALGKNVGEFVSYLESDLGMSIAKADDTQDDDEDPEDAEGAEGGDEDNAEAEGGEGDDNQQEQEDMADRTNVSKGAEVVTMTKADFDEVMNKAATAQATELAKRDEQIATLLKAQQAVTLSKAADALVGNLGVDKAKLITVLEALDETQTTAITEIFAGLNKAASSAGIFQTFGKADRGATNAGENGAENKLLAMAAERGAAMRKAAGRA